MSHYIILAETPQYNKDCIYTGMTYELWRHTHTKYANNEPYFSTDLSPYKTKYGISKEDLPNQLKDAQHYLTTRKRQPVRQSRVSKIFVLKVNSPKMFYILNPKYSSPHLYL